MGEMRRKQPLEQIVEGRQNSYCWTCSSFCPSSGKPGRSMSDSHWQLEGSAAELYERITSKWAEDLVDRAQLRNSRGFCAMLALMTLLR